jgi:hypothetical protein
LRRIFETWFSTVRSLVEEELRDYLAVREPARYKGSCLFLAKGEDGRQLIGRGAHPCPQRIDVSEIGRERSIFAFSGVSFFPFSAPRLGMAPPHLNLIH